MCAILDLRYVVLANSGSHFDLSLGQICLKARLSEVDAKEGADFRRRVTGPTGPPPRSLSSHRESIFSKCEVDSRSERRVTGLTYTPDRMCTAARLGGWPGCIGATCDSGRRPGRTS